MRAYARRFILMTSGSMLIVQALDAAPDGMTARQLGEQVDRNPGHVRRILGQLADEGYVQVNKRVWTRTEMPSPPSPVPRKLHVPVIGVEQSMLRQLAAVQGRSVVDITSEAIGRYYVAVTGEPIPETPLAS